MKTIGLLGGMSWQSTALYYQQLNEGVSQNLGGLHSAKILLHSIDFHEIERLQHSGDWDACADILAKAARGLEQAGADIMMIGTNTMHMVADTVQDAIGIPLLHIADATAEKLKSDGVKTVALLGTAFTMEKDFYKNRLIEHYGIDVIVPDSKDRELIHRVIYDELCVGIIKNKSRENYLAVIEKCKQQGAQAVILGCTEITLLISQDESTLPVYDTTAIHAEKAVGLSLEG